MSKSTIFAGLGVCLILCLPLFPLVAWINALSTPAEYVSHVTLEAKFDPGPPIPYAATPEPASPEPHFIANQIQILKTKGILYPVIDELGIVDRWSTGLPTRLTREEAYHALLTLIKVSREPDSNLLVVTVTDGNSHAAAAIANTIAGIYQKKRMDISDRLISEYQGELSREADQQSASVQAAKAQLERIRARDNIHDPNPDAMLPPVTPPDAYYETAKEQYLDAKEPLDAALQYEQNYADETEKYQTKMNEATPILERAEPATAPSSHSVQYILIGAALRGSLFALGGAALLTVGLGMRRETSSSNPTPAS